MVIQAIQGATCLTCYDGSGAAHLHCTQHHWTACWGCDCRQSPEVVPLKATGSKPQAVAVFPLDCSGVDLDAGSVALLPA